MKEIEKFYDELKNFKDEIEKRRSKTVADQAFKNKSKAIFVDWKANVKPRLDQINWISNKHRRDIDQNLRLLFEESQKRVARTYIILDLLIKTNDVFFHHIIIPSKTKGALPVPLEFQKYVGMVSDADEKDYLQEAVDCIRAKAHRASVVIGWIAAMWNLQRKIESQGFKLFNRCYSNRYLKNTPSKKAKRVKRIEDFEYYPDSEILWITEDMGILDRSERRILEKCLELRNICAHPGKFKPKDKEVLVFFERITSVLLGK